MSSSTSSPHLAPLFFGSRGAMSKEPQCKQKFQLSAMTWSTPSTIRPEARNHGQWPIVAAWPFAHRGNPSGDGHPGAISDGRSHVRSLLLGSSLLEAFNPIDGPEVMGQVLLSDPGIGHVEVALVSPAFAPGIAHLRCGI